MSVGRKRLRAVGESINNDRGIFSDFYFLCVYMYFPDFSLVKSREKVCLCCNAFSIPSSSLS